MIQLVVVISLGVALALGITGAVIYVKVRGKADVKARLRGLRMRITQIETNIPSQPSPYHSEFPTIDASAAIEAWLMQDKPKNALVAAAQAVNRQPKDGKAYVHLARALILCDEVDYAAKALMQAKLLGEDSPAYLYLEARLRLAMSKARKERSLDRPTAMAVLEILLQVVEQDPYFGDAAYHAGLLAIDLGLEAEGRKLLRRVEPLMEHSPERSRYLKDIESLN